MKQKEMPSRTTLRVKKHNALWRLFQRFVKTLSKLCDGQVVPLFWENVAQHLTKCCPAPDQKLGNIWASRAYMWAFRWAYVWACVPACVGVRASSLAKTFHKIKSSFRYLKGMATNPHPYMGTTVRRHTLRYQNELLQIFKSLSWGLRFPRDLQILSKKLSKIL